MEKYHVVIARYNEDIAWSKNFDSSKFKIKIYNKGEDNLGIEPVRLDNIGREAHTFIHYIIEHYYELPEYVVFLQGNPFEHCKNLMESINNHTDQDCVMLSDHIVTETIDSWYENSIDLYATMPYPNMFRCGLRETAHIIFGEKIPSHCTFAAGLQYIVNRKYILNKNLNFYKKIMDRFKIDFVLPWHIERIWPDILKFTTTTKKNYGNATRNIQKTRT